MTKQKTKTEYEEKQRLMEETKRGLLALAESEVSRFERLNQQVIKRFEQKKNVREKTLDYFKEIYDNFMSLRGAYKIIDDDLSPFEEMGKRYNELSSDRQCLLALSHLLKNPEVKNKVGKKGYSIKDFMEILKE